MTAAGGAPPGFAFVERPAVRPEVSGLFRLLEPMRYRGWRDSWWVPAGAVTDFASIPRACRALLPSFDTRYGMEAILHDFLCVVSAMTPEADGTVLIDLGDGTSVRVPWLSRREADAVFRQALLLREDVPPPLAWTLWAAVRVGGRMRGADVREMAQVAAIGTIAVPLIAIPVAVVQVWLWAGTLAWATWNRLS